MIAFANGSVLEEYGESPPNAKKKGATAARPERPRAKADSLLTRQTPRFKRRSEQSSGLSSIRQRTRSSDGGAGVNGFEPPKERGRPSAGAKMEAYQRLGDVNRGGRWDFGY
jgi:hypothetical protein